MRGQESKDLAQDVLDQRRVARQAIEAPVRMRIETDFVAGVSDNLSAAGLLFFTDEPLRVVVELEVQGELRKFTGRLVRAQRMNERNTGLAVEFDE